MKAERSGVSLDRQAPLKGGQRCPAMRSSGPCRPRRPQGTELRIWFGTAGGRLRHQPGHARRSSSAPSELSKLLAMRTVTRAARAGRAAAGMMAMSAMFAGAGCGSSDGEKGFDRQAELEKWSASYPTDQAMCIVNALQVYYDDGGEGDPRDNVVGFCTTEAATVDAPPATDQPASTSPANTVGEATTGTSPSTTLPATTAVASAGYSTQSVLWTNSEGWSYRFTPVWGDFTLSFSKSIEFSPPGEARLVADFVLQGEMGGRLDGATPGRTPPGGELNSVVLNYDVSGMRLDSDSLFVCDDIDGMSCSFGVTMFNSTVMGGVARAEGSDQDEADVNRLVSELNSMDPSIKVGLGVFNACEIFYLADGRVELDSECDMAIDQ